MAKRTKIDWKMEGFEEARKDPRVYKKLEELAEEIKKEASDNGRVEGYIVAPRLLQEERAAFTVLAFGHAYNHDRKYHTLIKAMYKAKGNNS